MKKSISMAAVVTLLLMVLLTGMASAEAVSQTAEDFEGYAAGTDLMGTVCQSAGGDLNGAAIAVTAADRNGSRVLKYTYTTEGTSKWCTLKLGNFSHTEFDGVTGFSLWLDLSEYANCGLTVQYVDGNGVTWSPKNTSGGDATYHYVFDFDEEGKADEVGSSAYGNFWIGSNSYVGTLKLDLKDYEPSPAGAAASGISQIVLACDGAEGKSIYVDNIQVTAEATSTGPVPVTTKLPEKSKVAQDFSDCAEGAWPGNQMTLWPAGGASAAVVKNGADKELEVTIKTEEWVDFGISKLDGKWKGAEYLAFTVDMENAAGLGLQPVLTDAAGARYDFVGEKFFLIAEDGKMYELASGAGQCRFDTETYGTRVTIAVPFSGFELSEWSDVKDSTALSLDGVKCVRFGFPPTGDGFNLKDKSFRICEIKVLGDALEATSSSRPSGEGSKPPVVTPPTGSVFPAAALLLAGASAAALLVVKKKTRT